MCLALGACGGEDSPSESRGNGSETDNHDGDDPEGDDFDANQQHSNQQDSNQQDLDQQDSSQQDSSQESECDSSSECELVVCDCFDGPVNFQGCSVVNGSGTCATEATCASSFGACD